MMFIVRFLTLFLVAGIALFPGALPGAEKPPETTAPAVVPQTPVTLNIPAQPLDEALNAFARQARLQILLDYKAGRGLKAAGLSGTYLPVEALERLLAGTGLEYRFVDKRTVAIL